MIISLIPLNTRGRVDFEQKLESNVFTHNQVKELNNVKVKGTIVDNGTDDYEVQLEITGQIILKSSVNGSDVIQDLNIKYHDFIENFVENYKNSSNSLDILPIIWENILLEIPIRAVNSEDEFELASGSGWEIISEED